MSFGRSAREEAIYQATLYPGTDTPRNKLGIKDRTILESAERTLVAERQEQGLPPKARELSYAGFKAIHGHLFQDVYDWAGTERQYTTGRGAAPFALPENIAPWMKKRFAILSSENNLVGLKKDAFAARAAEHVNEINAAHPFIDGNGRTQRTWLRVLADNAGYEFSLSGKDRDTWNAASRTGFERADHRPMEALLRDRLVERPRELSRDQGARER